MSGVAANQVVKFGTRTFQIQAVLNPDERTKVLKLLCTEINDSNNEAVMEERAIKIEVRTAADDPDSTEGYVALFDSLSQDLGGFRELIKPGAFTRALAESDDILALSHTILNGYWAGQVPALARSCRTTAGLKFRCKMLNTSLGRDMREMISRATCKSAVSNSA